MKKYILIAGVNGAGKSILGNIEKAKERKYSIELHYVGVDSAEIAKNESHFGYVKGDMV